MQLEASWDRFVNNKLYIYFFGLKVFFTGSKGLGIGSKNIMILSANKINGEKSCPVFLDIFDIDDVTHDGENTNVLSRMKQNQSLEINVNTPYNIRLRGRGIGIDSNSLHYQPYFILTNNVKLDVKFEDNYYHWERGMRELITTNRRVPKYPIVESLITKVSASSPLCISSSEIDTTSSISFPVRKKRDISSHTELIEKEPEVDHNINEVQKRQKQRNEVQKREEQINEDMEIMEALRLLNRITNSHYSF